MLCVVLFLHVLEAIIIDVTSVAGVAQSFYRMPAYKTYSCQNEMLLRTDNDGMTGWHEAAFGGELDLMLKIWEWAKERLTTEEIKNEILLRTDHD